MQHAEQREVPGRSRFRLLLRIASGGMGTVYLAQQRGAAGFQRLVAVKRAHPHLLEDPSAMRMLAMEAHLSSLLHHPNVVGVTDLEETDGDVLMVMEYIEGATLAEINRDPKNPVSIPVGVRMILDVCDGLEALHRVRDPEGNELGVVHRDVSPQNILVGIDGIARLADLGIARACARQGSISVVRGKPSYMAPEYLSTGRATPAADVFALGVVAWETLSRRRLHEDAVGGEPVWPPRPNSIAPPSNYVTGIPRAVDDVILRALALDPEDRFASAKSFGAALERALGSANVATRQQVGAAISERFGSRLDARREMLKHATPVDPRERMPSKPDLLSVIADNTPRPTVEELSPLPVTYRTRNRMARLAAFVGAAIVVMGAVMVSLFVRKGDESSRGTLQGAAQPRLASVAASAETGDVAAPSAISLRLPASTAAPTAGAASAGRPASDAVGRAPGTAVAPTPTPSTLGRSEAAPAEAKPPTSSQPPPTPMPAVLGAPRPSKPASYVLTPPTIAPDNPYDR